MPLRRQNRQDVSGLGAPRVSRYHGITKWVWEGSVLPKRLSFVVAIACLALTTVAVASPTLNCKIGPIENIYGGTKWLVYGCDDKASVVVVTAPGNPAMPFYFFFQR